MIDELSVLLEEFPGAANRTRCFTHILNLVAKSILKQFDLPKAKAGEALSTAMEALSDLAGDIEAEEAHMGGDSAEDDDSDDDEDGLADPWDMMTDDEIAELDESLQPVRLVLVKVISVWDLSLFLVSTNIYFLFTSASKTRFYHQELNNNCSTGMDVDLGSAHRGQQSCKNDAPFMPYDAARRFNPMELHIRHAEVCSGIPRTTERFDW